MQERKGDPLACVKRSTFSNKREAINPMRVDFRSCLW